VAVQHEDDVMAEELDVRQVIPYLALFMDANTEVAAEAARLGLTHADLQKIDRCIAAIDDERGM
jgi:hypothetical protein